MLTASCPRFAYVRSLNQRANRRPDRAGPVELDGRHAALLKSAKILAFNGGRRSPSVAANIVFSWWEVELSSASVSASRRGGGRPSSGCAARLASSQRARSEGHPRFAAMLVDETAC